MATIRFKRILPSLIRETEAEQCEGGGGELAEIYQSYIVSPNPDVFIEEAYILSSSGYVQPDVKAMTPQTPV